MPAEFFLDSSAWFPIVYATDPYHARLSRALQSLMRGHRRAVTTNLVVAETHALFLRRRGRDDALRFLGSAERSSRVVIRSTAELEALAVRDWIERYQDQSFSLADAVSFAVMKERRIADVLTLDHHFAAAGFRIVGLDG